MGILTRILRPQQVEAQKKQKAILNYVRIYYDKRGEFPPTADIALGTGYGIGTVNYHLEQLHKERLIPDSLHSTRKGKESVLPVPSVDRADTRLAVIEYMGGRCVRCGFDDVRALQIDHINGNGARDRKDSGGTYQIYRKLYKKALRNEVIEGYQILCANCNWIKRHDNHEHK